MIQQSFTTTLDKLLGGLESAAKFVSPSTHVEVNTSGDANQMGYSVRFPETSFSGESLRSLLVALSPHGDSQSIFGIVADWGIVDSDSAYATRLVEMHKHLDPHWTQFNESHRRALIASIDNQAPDYAKIIDYIEKRLFTMEQVEGAVRHAVRGPLLVDIYAATRSGRPSNKFVKHLSYDHKNRLKSEVLRDYQKLLKVARGNCFDDKLIIDRHGAIIRQPLTIEFGLAELSPSRWEISSRNATAIAQISPEQRRVVAMQPQGATLKLQMSWKTADEKRIYDFSSVPDDYNTLLGFIYGATFFDKPQELFPKAISLPGSKYQQRMGEAQVPLLAMIFRNRLVNSPFFTAVERFVQEQPTPTRTRTVYDAIRRFASYFR